MGLSGGKQMERSTTVVISMMMGLLILATYFTPIAGLSYQLPAPLSGRHLVQTHDTLETVGRHLVQIHDTLETVGRHLVQTHDTLETVGYTDETARVDPLDSFKKYRGGYNLTNKHYWSSTIFTGVYGYAIGVLWLLFGIILGIVLAVSSLCGSPLNKKSSKFHHQRSYCDMQLHLWSVLLTVFMVVAVVAMGLVLGGNAKFHSRAKTVVDIIMETANEATETIRNTTGAMKEIRATLEISKGITVGSIADLSDGATGFLGSTSQRLDSEADEIQRQASKNRRLINKGLKIVYIITSVTISMNLVAVIALSAAGFLKLGKPLYWLISVCWSLTFLCWLLFGMHYFFGKFSSDTCMALENFQQNPNNNSLSSILPCNELLSAKSILSDVGAGIYYLVNEVNANISLLQSTAYPNLFNVCNPFSAPPELLYEPDNCPPNTIRIGDIPKVLKFFTCSDENIGNCSEGDGGLFISASNYNTMEAYTSSIQTLLNAYPSMESLIECQSVKDAFADILLHHCWPLNRYVHMVWAALVALGVVMVFLVLIWIGNTMHEQKCHMSLSA